jgi:integrase/recombinase XerD
VSAAELSLFLARECPGRSVSRAADLVVAVRSVLRWLHMEGRIGAPLEWAVPGIADLRDRSLPRGVEPAVVNSAHLAHDRFRHPAGRRAGDRLGDI